MSVLDLPSNDEIATTVRGVLDSEQAITFRELERKVEEQLPNLANRVQVRQAAWDLISIRAAELTKDLKIRVLEGSNGNGR